MSAAAAERMEARGRILDVDNSPDAAFYIRMPLKSGGVRCPRIIDVVYER